MIYVGYNKLPNQIEFQVSGLEEPLTKEFTLFELMEIIDELQKLDTPILTINHGEPLSEDNLFITDLVVSEVKRVLPDALIFIYTHLLEIDLINLCGNNHYKDICLKAVVIPIEKGDNKII